MSPERKIPGPPVNPETKPFWDAAAAGKLLAQALHRVRARPTTTRARSARSAPATGPSGRRPSGRGTVYSYSVFRRAPVPYAIAYVTLDEGVSMMTNIVDCDLDTIRVGQAVRVVYKATEDGPPVPMFTPA